MYNYFVRYMWRSRVGTPRFENSYGAISFHKAKLILALSLLAVSAAHGAALSNLIVDQFGWRTYSAKVAILAQPNVGVGSPSSFTPGSSFQILQASNSTVVFTGSTSAWNGGAVQSQSGDLGWWADFSSFTTPGTYVLSVPGGSNPGALSYPFSIGDGVYQAVLQAAVRMYFYQRCGEGIVAATGGQWVHAACHQQEAAADLYDGSDQGQPIDIRGGWHDAGDYRKYVSWTFPTLWRLMKAYEWYPCVFGDATGIPESYNGVPDILDEVKWELDWLLKMQASSGALYSGAFVTAGGGNTGLGDPSQDDTVYYHGNISSGATSTGAMAFAMASRLFAPYTGAYPGYSATLLAAAQGAWAWLQANPSNVQFNAANFSNANSNIAANEDFDRRVAAAAELFRTTGNAAYQSFVDANYSQGDGAALLSGGFVPANADSMEIGMVEYADTPGATASAVNAILAALKSGADSLLVGEGQADLYRSYMWDGYYTWGSNSEKGMWGDLGIWASQLRCGTPANQASYRAASEEYLHYFHGRNPLNWVYLSNMGAGGAGLGASQSVNSIYHSWFWTGTQYDGLVPGAIGPAPGILTGGPNPSYTPDPSYTGSAIVPPENEPLMKSYRNWGVSWPQDSWEVTEPDLAYQAPYVLLAAAFVPCSGPQPTETPTPSATPYAGTPTCTFTLTRTVTPTSTITPPVPLYAPCNGCAMTLDGVFSESVYGMAAWQSIGDSGSYCAYVNNGCGAVNIGVTANFKASWNPTSLWIAVQVSDSGALEADPGSPFWGDGVEVFLDVNDVRAGFNTATQDYDDPNTYQWCITYNANGIVQYRNATARTIHAASVVTAGTGYSMEIEVPWASLGVSAPNPGSLSGLDVAVDVSTGVSPPARDHQIAAFNATLNEFDENPYDWGAIQYQACGTPTMTPTRSPSFSCTPSASSTPTQTATLTASASSTPTPTATLSPTVSATASATLTATPSPTASATPTATPTATPVPTGSTLTDTLAPSNTPTPSATPSGTAAPGGPATPSATATASATVTPTRAPTAASGAGALVVLQAVPVPNPNAGALAVELLGPADSVDVRVFDQAMILVGSVRSGAMPANWGRISLDSAWFAGLPPGVYFVQVKALRGGAVSKAVLTKLLLTRRAAR